MRRLEQRLNGGRGPGEEVTPLTCPANVKVGVRPQFRVVERPSVGSHPEDSQEGFRAIPIGSVPRNARNQFILVAVSERVPSKLLRSPTVGLG